MAMHHLSSVALTNEHHEVMDCMTASDFRYFVLNPPGIFQPANEYLKNNRGDLSLVVVYPGDTIETVIAKMVEKNVHHVWVMGEGNKPMGSIDATDIIAFIA
jgi:CBS-domain-containing membrane protein